MSRDSLADSSHHLKNLKKLIFDQNLKKYLENVVDTLSESKSDLMSDDDHDYGVITSTLRNLLFHWATFKDIISTLSHILLFLDKTYLLPKGTSISAIGKDLWKEYILLNPALSLHWSKVVADGILYIRTLDNSINPPTSDARPIIAPLLKSVFDMWRELNLYFVNEKLVLDNTRSYYSYFSLDIVQKIDLHSADSSASSISFQDYLHMVCKIIDKEAGLYLLLC